jgi:hypothetical protein
MLWKQLSPGYRRLLRNGSRGEAVVVEAQADRQKNSRIGGIMGWQMTIRVKFADGSTADYERYLEASVVTDDDGRSVLDPTAGMILPIRFNPDDRSKVEIDTVALTERELKPLDP